MVVAEAMANSTAVLTTTETPWSQIKENDIGWIVKPTEHELTECLNNVLSNDVSVFEDMGRKSNKWVKENYGWDVIVEDMLATYGWLLGVNEKPDCVYLD